MSKEKAPAKKKGPIRTEVVAPLIIIIVASFVYFHFFFDHNMRKALEFIGYEVIGAEVDIADLETNFIKGTLRIQGVEITNSQNPERDMLVVGDIRFAVLWDGLLRARLVIDEMAVEQIQIDVPRKSKGKVKPPDPKKEEDSGALGKAANDLKNKTLHATAKQDSNNALGDIAMLLSGNAADTSKLQAKLASKQKLDELQKMYAEKSKSWQQKLASLPTQQDIQVLGDRASKIKTSNFKTPQELVDSISQLQAVTKDADLKYKNVQDTSQSLSSDLKTFDQGIKDVDGLVKQDISTIESQFHIPKLDSKSLAEAVFKSYLDPYLARLGDYREYAEKMLPQNTPKKSNPKEPDITMQARPRARGTSYEFGKPHAYPMFWVKKISISSKANPTLGTGNMSGQITDITSNQLLVGRPTLAQLQGDFPSKGVEGFRFDGSFDNRQTESQITFDTSVAHFPIEGRPVVDSDAVNVAFNKADASLKSKGELTGFRDMKFNLENSLQKVDYAISAKDPNVQDVMKTAFNSLPVLSITAEGHGHLPALDLAIDSNLGPELTKGFQKAVQKKIDEARANIQKYVNDQIGAQKSQLEGEYNKSKAQVDDQVKKVQAQLDTQKKQVEKKSDQAQKDGQNKAQKQMQDQGKKTLDDLKSKLGL